MADLANIIVWSPDIPELIEPTMVIAPVQNKRLPVTNPADKETELLLENFFCTYSPSVFNFSSMSIIKVDEKCVFSFLHKLATINET